ncbi:T9SS type A sorting domain-containing protein [Flavobacterium sp. CYK-55]|uniref:T9SS type A sorting domain-containing protein n=1 Tax=Flavobacterium sp. CYK-55 TaxID=2835529 RepID=UPI001BCBAA91|nr:T9SS type A sorting domain-containing protein [Flavobacterium sp. CYK-55]MBS7787866.1 T9SS type A sorting domain-containing protein [Flavobacterium sp. CYK-55]
MKPLKIFLLLIFITHNSFAQCWTQIAAGDNHSLALKSDGTLWAWGQNDQGQLGDGTIINRVVPTQIGTDTDWSTIDAIGFNSMALKSNGTLWTWGANYYGQIGNGSFGSGAFNSTPTQVGNDSDWIKISTGGIKTFALKSNGTIWGWGYNIEGHLGLGNTDNHSTPFQIGTDTDWVEIKASLNQTMSIKGNHTVWGWGLNKEGSLAIGNPNDFIAIPTQVGGNNIDWQKLDSGGCCSTKMIKTDGSLWAMGSAANGNLGTGGTVDVNTPTRVGTDNDWKTVTTDLHSCAIKNDGTLWVWGFNFFGQLGDGTNTVKTLPTQIATNQTWLMVKAGFQYTLAISSDHSLYAWGRNTSGQLGDGTLVNKNVPTLIGNSCPLSTPNFDNLKSIRTFPNPSNDKVTLQYILTQEGLVNVSITNSLGQLISSRTEKNNSGEQNQTVDLSSFSQGIYFITLQTDNLRNTIKIVKE